MPQQTNHKHPAFANFHNRLNTFANWPRLEVITPNELAAAGFFFEGPCDSVKCYSCGGGIRNWEAGDDPWVIHAESFPWCSFVLTEKGLAYIEEHSKDNDHQLLDVGEENVVIHDFLACKVCKQKHSNTLLMPCSHMACCETCAEQITHCVVCDAFVIARIRTFMS